MCWYYHSFNEKYKDKTFDVVGFKGIIPFVSILCVILSMIGCPFLIGFYSKYLIIEFLYISEIRIFFILIMLISLSLTVIYSLGLFYYLFFMKIISFISVGSFNERKLINFSLVLLMVLKILRGSLLSVLFFLI